MCWPNHSFWITTWTHQWPKKNQHATHLPLQFDKFNKFVKTLIKLQTTIYSIKSNVIWFVEICVSGAWDLSFSLVPNFSFNSMYVMMYNGNDVVSQTSHLETVLFFRHSQTHWNSFQTYLKILIIKRYFTTNENVIAFKPMNPYFTYLTGGSIKKVIYIAHIQETEVCSQYT